MPTSVKLAGMKEDILGKLLTGKTKHGKLKDIVANPPGIARGGGKCTCPCHKYPPGVIVHVVPCC